MDNGLSMHGKQKEWGDESRDLTGRDVRLNINYWCSINKIYAVQLHRSLLDVHSTDSYTADAYRVGPVWSSGSKNTELLPAKLGYEEMGLCVCESVALRVQAMRPESETDVG